MHNMHSHAILYMDVILTIPCTHSTSFQCPQSFKVCECVAYLVHSDYFITVDNFSMCVHCVRHFIETAASKQALDHDLDQELFPSFTPPTFSKDTPTVIEESHSEERESKERWNDCLSSAVTSSSVAIPATFSQGNASPPPAPNIGSPHDHHSRAVSQVYSLADKFMYHW